MSSYFYRRHCQREMCYDCGAFAKDDASSFSLCAGQVVAGSRHSKASSTSWRVLHSQ